jgi:polyisoprenoid-binding protein YceI
VRQFPFISYHSLTTERRGTGGWRVNGELDLHGRIHPLSMDAVSKNDRFTGSVTFRQSDFGIVPISIVAGTVKVRDEVTIEFDIAIIKGDTVVTSEPKS